MSTQDGGWSGDDLVRVFAALGNPHRVRVVAALVEGRCHVSELARRLRISRPLLQVHLRRLEEVGLVRSHVEVAADARARRFYELTPFSFAVTPESLAEAATRLTDRNEEQS
jgi:ArsR family transcriptional regulator, zinc-responsive transcriptional repressor